MQITDCAWELPNDEKIADRQHLIDQADLLAGLAQTQWNDDK